MVVVVVVVVVDVVDSVVVDVGHWALAAEQAAADPAAGNLRPKPLHFWVPLNLSYSHHHCRI